MHPRRPHHRAVAKAAMIVSFFAFCTRPVLAQQIIWQIYIDDGNEAEAAARYAEAEKLYKLAVTEAEKFGPTLVNDDYTITIRDTVRSLGGVPIDGDKDGINGGDAVFTIRHRLRQGSDNDRDVDLEDFTVFQETLTGP